MKLSLVERETILLYNQAEPMAEVYTHDPRLMEKLELLAKKHPDQITRKDAHNFTVPHRGVSVREPYSAERRKAASERAKAAGYQQMCIRDRLVGLFSAMIFNLLSKCVISAVCSAIHVFCLSLIHI